MSRPPEAVDRLLWIPDEKKRARAAARTMSSRRHLRRVGGSPQSRQKISVCSGSVSWKLVHQHMPVASSQRAAHRIVIAQQVAGGEDQVVEVEKRRRSLVVAKTGRRPVPTSRTSSLSTRLAVDCRNADQAAQQCA